eukprot:Hpha_TRINITY_DN16246_c1_g7::TRINITY_DN16246_c1_g7_i1::g.13078::m.13078/K00555/TRMT1, trm1; tRNA (guanine26-N2/guanine27-N2)-dimethyltransferase
MSAASDVRRQLAVLCKQLADEEQRIREAAAEGKDDASGKRSRQGLDDPTPEGFSKVSEGLAGVLEKSKHATAAGQQQEVFYNPAQVVNRDLSILMIRCYDAFRKGPGRIKRGGRAPEAGLRVLEALAATGLRTVRYWKEIPGLDLIISNDIDPSAVDAIKRNLEYNGIPPTKVLANCDDAVQLMHRLAEPKSDDHLMRVSGDSASLLLHGEKCDVVDLDPYGTASPFLEGAVRCAEEGALLCITCTDSDCLCGVHTEVSHHKYGALTVRAKYCHEMAVRILLGCIERHAIRHGKYITPLLSLHIDFYVRVFVRIRTSKAEAKLSIGKLGHLVQCSSCVAFWVKPIGTVRGDTPDSAEKQWRGNKRRKLKHQRKGGGGGEEAAEGEAAGEEEPPAAERLSAAIPPLPSRENPRLKYVTANSSLLHCTELPAEGSPASVCCVCGHPQWVGGPVWARPIHDPEFVKGAIAHLDEHKAEFPANARVRSLLAAARDELPDAPMFYHVPTLCSSLKASTIPPTQLATALESIGYRVSGVHSSPDGLKTDAPPEVLYDVLRCWIAEDPKRSAATSRISLPSEDARPPAKYAPPPKWSDQPAEAMLSVPPRVRVHFAEHKRVSAAARAAKEKKWIPNPENWGPKPRAKAQHDDDDGLMEQLGGAAAAAADDDDGLMEQV